MSMITGSGPFFCSYPAPDGYEERYRERWIPPDLAALGGSTHQHLAGYYGMVKRLDEAFGRLIDALRSLDLLENTIVLFTADHGCHFKTRNAEYKRSCRRGPAAPGARLRTVRCAAAERRWRRRLDKRARGGPNPDKRGSGRTGHSHETLEI